MSKYRNVSVNCKPIFGCRIPGARYQFKPLFYSCYLLFLVFVSVLICGCVGGLKNCPTANGNHKIPIPPVDILEKPNMFYKS
jgi:hypothetical protein